MSVRALIRSERRHLTLLNHELALSAGSAASAKLDGAFLSEGDVGWIRMRFWFPHLKELKAGRTQKETLCSLAFQPGFMCKIFRARCSGLKL